MTAKQQDSNVFAHRIRTLSIEEIEKVSGADPYSNNDSFSGMKNVSAQDNQVRTMS